ncbi:MAG: CRISPR-associated endonuclease Cas1 [Vicinamibacterales bacterium]
MSAEPAPTRLHVFPRPTPAAARLKTVLPDYLPARMLNEFVYCPRLFFYEWVEGVFAHSADTVGGSLRHEALDARSDSLPGPEDVEGLTLKARGVMLSSDVHHLIAKIDLVEVSDGTVAPIDYKIGRPKEGDDGLEAWPADRTQLCAQALVLRDNGYVCHEAVAYYHATRQRVRITIDDSLVAETLDALTKAKSIAERGRIPPPLEDSAKCPRCSLVGICLPDETAAALAWRAEEAGDQLELFAAVDSPIPEPLATTPAGELRRLVPARDDLRPLYVTGYGLTVGKSGEVLEVRERKQLVQEARVKDICQLNVFGSVHVTSAVIEALCMAEKPIAHFSLGGWFYGLTQGLGLRNVFLRRGQFDRAGDDDFCLVMARAFIVSKIRNQRTMLQRNHVEPPARVVGRLKGLAVSASRCENLETLLGIEGTAARLYFEHFVGMLKAENDDGSLAFDFEHRNRRPPRDPVNAMLSLAYAFLARDLTIICHTIGFDPFIGFYHQPRFGRPALALDLMEEFRPLVADSAVITAINTRMVTPDCFVRTGSAVSLDKRGRTGLIRAVRAADGCARDAPDLRLSCVVSPDHGGAGAHARTCHRRRSRALRRVRDALSAASGEVTSVAAPPLAVFKSIVWCRLERWGMLEH